MKIGSIVKVLYADPDDDWVPALGSIDTGNVIDDKVEGKHCVVLRNVEHFFYKTMSTLPALDVLTDEGQVGWLYEFEVEVVVEKSA